MGVSYSATRFGLATPVDPNGNFVFRSLPPGTRTLYLTLDGINPISEKKSVVVEDQAQSSVEFILDTRDLNKPKER